MKLNPPLQVTRVNARRTLYRSRSVSRRADEDLNSREVHAAGVHRQIGWHVNQPSTATTGWLSSPRSPGRTLRFSFSGTSFSSVSPLLRFSLSARATFASLVHTPRSPTSPFPPRMDRRVYQLAPCTPPTISTMSKQPDEILGSPD